MFAYCENRFWLLALSSCHFHGPSGIKNMDMTQKKKNKVPKSGVVAVDYLALALEYKDANPRAYIRFLKPKAQNFFRDVAFWQSPLPSLHLEAVLDSDLQAPYFTEFFSKKENLNISLLQLIAAENTVLFQKYFKLRYTHRIPAFRQALAALAEKVVSLRSFSREIESVVLFETKLNEERDQRDHFFLMLPPDRMIFGFLVWHQRLKVSESVKGNWGRMVSLEVNMLNEIERVLQKGCKAGKFKDVKPMFLDQTVVDRQWKNYAARRPFEKAPEIEVPLPDTLQMLLNVVEFAHRSWYEFATIERYLAGHLDLTFDVNGRVIPVENDSSKRYQYDDRKTSYEEKYFLNKSKYFENLDELIEKRKSREIHDSISASIMKMEFYGEPMVMPFQGQEIDLCKVLRLLQLFSEFKGPIRDNPLDPNQPNLAPNLGPKLFVEALGPNESLSVFESETFAAKIAQALDWLQEDATAIVDFLTWNLESSSPSTHFIRRPFLRFANRIFWMGTVLQDRNWLFAMQMRLRSNEMPSQFQNVLSTQFEKQIMKSFARAGFVAAQGLPFTTKTGERGDLDVVAYKDKYIFIAEAKNTLVEQGFVESTFVETVRFQAKAAFQLDKCLEYATEAKADLLARLGVSPTEYGDLAEIEVYPMIVARHFEGDQVYYRDHPKLSYVELEIIITNGLDDLYGKDFRDHRFFHFLHDRNNPNFRNRPINDNERRDLWEGQGSLSPEILIRCIEEGRVWKEFQETWAY